MGLGLIQELWRATWQQVMKMKVIRVSKFHFSQAVEKTCMKMFTATLETTELSINMRMDKQIVL